MHRITTALFLLTLLISAPRALCEPPVLVDKMVPPEMLKHGFTLVLEDKSGLADDNTPIYFASNINGWNPGDDNWMLTHRSDGRWQITIEQPPAGTILEFKFALGSWQSEELDGSGQPIANRMLDMIDPTTIAPGEPAEIRLSVPEFRPPVDVPEWGLTPAFDPAEQWTGRIETLSVRGGAGRAIGHERDLFIWLPGEYDKADGRTYPVLYLMDGQNIFASPPGVPGEWHADETAARLIKEGRIQPIIIVGVPNAGLHRADEYLPYGDIRGARPSGDAFIKWMQRTVMPAVAKRYSVSTKAEHTAIGGASLGGTISLYAATQHPDAFGLALVESLPMLDENADAPRASLEAVKRWPGKIVIGMGGREVSAHSADFPRNRKYTAWAREVDQRLAKAGLDDSHRLLLIDHEASHNEQAWAERFPEALEFLFPPSP